MAMSGVDKVGTVVSLSLPILAAIVVLVAQPRVAVTARARKRADLATVPTPDTGSPGKP